MYINFTRPFYNQIKDLTPDEYNRFISKPVISTKKPKIYKDIRKYDSVLLNWITNSSIIGVNIFWLIYLNILPVLNIDLTGSIPSFFLWVSFAYYIHRKNHQNITEKTSKFNRWWMFNIHGFHHLFPHHPKNIVIPVWVSSIIIIPFTLFSYFVFPTDLAFGCCLGFIVGHLYIEWTHFAMHYEIPFFSKFTRILKLKTHHMNHHYINSHRRFTYFHSIEDRIHNTD